MERINKKFGRMMSKGPGDNAKVAIMLKEYDDADKMLAKVNHHKPPTCSALSRPFLPLPPRSTQS